MAFAEALSYGLPIIASGAGAVANTVPQSAGIHVPGGNPTALQNALRQLLNDPDLRARLQHGALQAAQNLPLWHDSVRQFACILEAVR